MDLLTLNYILFCIWLHTLHRHKPQLWHLSIEDYRCSRALVYVWACSVHNIDHLRKSWISLTCLALSFTTHHTTPAHTTQPASHNSSQSPCLLEGLTTSPKNSPSFFTLYLSFHMVESKWRRKVIRKDETLPLPEDGGEYVRVQVITMCQIYWVFWVLVLDTGSHSPMFLRATFFICLFT